MVRLAKLIAGVGLVAVGAVGIYHGVRASIAAALYHEAKYGAASRTPEEIFRLCGRAHRLYPYSYAVSQWAADTAWNSRYADGVDTWLKRVEETERWTDRALAQNPYLMNARQMKARLLALYSPTAAVPYWQTFLDWAFWNPEHHFVMVELCLETGDFGGAVAALRWTQGSPFHDIGQREIREAWKRELDAGTRPR